MKKLIAFVTFTLIGMVAMNAQLKPSFGIKIGSKFAQYSSDIEIKDATGYHAGFVLHVPLNKKLGVQPEVIYSFSDVEDAFKVSTVDVPLLVTYKLVPGLRLNLGPQIKIDAGSDLDNGLEAAEAEFNALNFDAIAGLEYKFPIIGIFVQARYQLGITNTVDGGKNEFVDLDDIKENGFLLSVGYRF